MGNKKHAGNKVARLSPRDKNLLISWFIYSVRVFYTYMRPKMKNFYNKPVILIEMFCPAVPMSSFEAPSLLATRSSITWLHLIHLFHTVGHPGCFQVFLSLFYNASAHTPSRVTGSRVCVFLRPWMFTARLCPRSARSVSRRRPALFTFFSVFLSPGPMTCFCSCFAGYREMLLE